MRRSAMDAMNKPYDIKRSFWIKDEKEAFIPGEIQPEDGDKSPSRPRWHMYMQSVSLACAGELRGKGSED
ncbi:hypothetical protein KUCAC02_008437 [Chaenocephalus aceratus]|uniref:Uncharacterized protein n=1 Tax=Chaenocephalus aceratus TaxID=36190 RepID=A0ACB9XAL0_CHAAC|nr:hypothetical protein KUCAC02_008437 [Chaenocephalus aceratus]